MDDLHYHVTVSVVVYDTDRAILGITLRSAIESLRAIRDYRSRIFLVNNSEADLSNLLSEFPEIQLIQGHGNIGFGGGHNLVLDKIGRYHLILNPDVVVKDDAILEGVRFLQRHSDCGLVTPYATWPNATRQYLSKRFPAALDLVFRGFAPKSAHFLWETRMCRYELRNETQSEVFWDPDVVSGCFMLFRANTLRQINGFDERYFLYFEDFDIAIRASRVARIAYVPTVKIIHHGGNAARKGLWHIRTFAKSALLFYSIHGFRFV